MSAHRDELDIYLSACEPISRDQFYQVQGMPDVARVGDHLEWRSPVQTAVSGKSDGARSHFFEREGIPRSNGDPSARVDVGQ